MPGKSLSASSAPKIFVSTTPAEMILLKGAPVYVPVKDSKLLWVSNTDSDVFRMGEKGLVYYLISGRWFSAPDFTGPWTFASTKLPPDFLKISLEHERSRVLASVPGSAQAAEAVLLASVPEKATVLRKEVKAPDVAYDGGKPTFKTIETTTVEHAVNTDKDVFKINDVYYMCFQGVWFKSTTPNGPWEVADSIPKEIYSIPVSSPAHNVTYVTVEESNDDAVVFATAAATGLMIAWGCVVWGSGCYYPPCWGYGYGYPMPGRYPSCGYSAWYALDRACGRSMGDADVWRRRRGAVRPRTGTYARAPWHTDQTVRVESPARNAAPAPQPQRGKARTAAAAEVRPPSRGRQLGDNEPLHQQPRHHARVTQGAGAAARSVEQAA